MENIGFAPLFDYNYSFLCSLTMEDLKNYRESMVKYDIGHKLGGSFDVVGREIMTPEIQAELPQHVDIPIHDRYNMDAERLALMEDIFQENYRNIKKATKDEL